MGSEDLGHDEGSERDPRAHRPEGGSVDASGASCPPGRPTVSQEATGNGEERTGRDTIKPEFQNPQPLQAGRSLE